jgi:hypothetical protein
MAGGAGFGAEKGRFSHMRRTTSFRLLIAGLATVMAGPALAQSCVRSDERTSFDLRALQSQLMVAALACGRDNDYNAFVRKFQRDLSGAYATMQGHYRRTAGGNAQRELDNFITVVANAHSQDGIRAGSHFCPLVAPLFQQAMSRSGAAELSALAQERNVLNPLAAADCPASAAPATRTASRQPARR